VSRESRRTEPVVKTFSKRERSQGRARRKNASGDPLTLLEKFTAQGGEEPRHRKGEAKRLEQTDSSLQSQKCSDIGGNRGEPRNGGDGIKGKSKGAAIQELVKEVRHLRN